MRRRTWEWCFAAARQHGDKPFLVYEGETWSFSKTMDQVDGLANLLVNTYGVKKGDRVAVAMRNYPEWVMSFAAIISVGAVNVSMNSWWTEDEMDFALVDSGATVLICDQQRYDIGAESCAKHGVKVLVARAEKPLPANVDKWEVMVKPGAPHPGADIQPDDDATILYTSGTTGRPKGAVSTHRAIISALMAFSARNGVLTMSGTKLKDIDGPEIPYVIYFDCSVVSRNRLRARDDELFHCRTETRDHVQVGRREGSRDDRARADHQLCWRANSKLGLGQLSSIR